MSNVQEQKPGQEFWTWDSLEGVLIMNEMIKNELDLDVHHEITARHEAGLSTVITEIAGGGYWGYPSFFPNSRIDQIISLRSNPLEDEGNRWNAERFMKFYTLPKEFSKLPIEEPGRGIKFFGDMYTPEAWQQIDGTGLISDLIICIPQNPFNKLIVGYDRHLYREFLIQEGFNDRRIKTDMEIEAASVNKPEGPTNTIKALEPQDYKTFRLLLDNMLSRLNPDKGRLIMQIPRYILEYASGKYGGRVILPFMNSLSEFLEDQAEQGKTVVHNLDRYDRFNYRRNLALISIQNP